MKKKVIVEDMRGNRFETERYEPRALTEADVKERVKNTPKIDVDALLKQGYMEANDFFHILENGDF